LWFNQFVSWIVAAYYTYRLARTVPDKSVVRCAVVLMVVLPVYFSLGLVMIADAPLIACWTGAAYYLHRVR
jgi:4-amino-4-deoxy-L-arabinose transferase-like glycosyltransferase